MISKIQLSILLFISICGQVATADVTVPASAKEIYQHYDFQRLDIYKVDEVHFSDDDTNTMEVRAPTNLADDTTLFVLPGTNGTADQVLKTDGSGNTSWGSAGSGEVNYVTSPNSADDWVDGGTGITATTTTTAAELPRVGHDSKALKLTNDDSGTAGQSICITVGEADKGKKLKIEWAQRVDGSLYETGDFEYKLVSDTSSTCVGTETGVVLHSSGDANPVSIPANNGVMYDEFDADDSDYYELYILRDTAAGIDTGWITISSVTVGPGKLHSGATVGAWQVFTPNWTSDTAHAPTTDDWQYRRVGDSMEIRGSYIVTADGTDVTDFSMDIPGGLSRGTLPDSVANPRHGYVQMRVGGSPDVQVGGSIYTTDATTLKFILDDGTTTVGAIDGNDIGVGTGKISRMIVHGTFLPILGWEGSGVLSTIVQDNLTEGSSFSPGDSSWGSASASGFWLHKGDYINLVLADEFDGTISGNLSWSVANFLPNNYTIDETKFVTGAGGDDRIPVGFWTAEDNAGTPSDYAGVVAYDVSSDLILFYQPAGGLVNSTSPVTWTSADGITVNIKLPVTEFAGSQSSLTGFSEVSQDFSGLVQSAGQLKGTNTNDSAASGYVGEHIIEASGGDITPTCGAFVEVNSIVISAGDWDVWGACVYESGGTNVTRLATAISQTSASSSGATNTGGYGSYNQASGNVAVAMWVNAGPRRISITGADDEIFLNCRVDCSAAAVNWDTSSSIQARRVR